VLRMGQLKNCPDLLDSPLKESLLGGRQTLEKKTGAGRAYYQASEE